MVGGCSLLHQDLGLASGQMWQRHSQLCVQLCRTQPSAGPSPQVIGQPHGPRAWRPWEKLQSTSHHTLCWGNHCEPDYWQSRTPSCCVKCLEISVWHSGSSPRAAPAPPPSHVGHLPAASSPPQMAHRGCWDTEMCLPLFPTNSWSFVSLCPQKKKRKSK